MQKTNFDTKIAEGHSTNERSIQTKFPVKIAKIGVQWVNESAEHDQVIKFGLLHFRLLTAKNFLNDINAAYQFDCRVFHETNENNEKEYTLWLVLVSNYLAPWSYWSRKQNLEPAKRLIYEFFIVPKNNLFEDNVDGSDDIEDHSSRYEKDSQISFESTVENLYKNLQDAHTADDSYDRYADEYIQHESLQVKLKPYQVKTIKWMLDRERVPKHHTSGFIEVTTRMLESSTKFYYNKVALTTNPEDYKRYALPTGGILAEQMGMGKTIEILDLILLNPRPLDRNQSVVPSGNKNLTPQALKMHLKCICCQSTTTNTVQCTKCLKHQHRKCVDQTDSEITPDFCYICPACWQSEEPLPAKTTLVISPQSIKAQWKTEADNRIQCGKMSILVYGGLRSCKWVNPKSLASYDIILTDYETCRGEFDYSARNSSDRVLRNTSMRIKRRSPLLNLDFWRICLDESQMVIDMKTRQAQLISDLSAVHRWAVTGTPIEKSINDLYSLLSFIKYEPLHRFSECINERLPLNYDPLVALLQPIMRRTCKSESIMNEMGVPEQVQEVHYVELNCLNRFQYNQEREKCRKEFNRLISSHRLNTPLTCLSPSTLERLMEPVRTLRRNCSILHVSDRGGQTIVLRPHQMLQYLFDTNEWEASFELKNIAKKMKSFVQLSLGNHPKRTEVAMQALSICQMVLDWSKKYEDEPIMVESLLRIQTIHNLLFINTNKGKEADAHNAHQRFYNIQLDAIVNFKTDRQKEMVNFANSELCFEKNCFQWVSAALADKTSHEQLFHQIKVRVTSSFENVGYIVDSISSILKALSYWSKNLLEKRKAFKRSFNELNTLAGSDDDGTESYHAREKRSEQFVAKLLKEAVDCHLTESVGDDSLNDLLDNGSPPSAKQCCILCTINEQLGSYGEFVSDVAHKMTKNAGRGIDSTNPSFQEYILKVILQSNEYSGNIDTKIGVDLLTALESFRGEFQKYKSLLLSFSKKLTNFYKVQKCQPPKPTITYCNRTIFQWWSDVEKSKTVYEGKVRVNRYLNCIKENGEIDECAICMSKMDQYIVFECGHQCCSDCFNKIAQGQSQFECPFCRRKQPRYRIHRFTMDKSEKFTDSSKKIEIIVRKVYELKKSDPKVKILIFSQWLDVLNALKHELLSNEIPSRSIVNTGKSFQKIVNQFKDPNSNVTCLLMQYRHGSKGLNLIEATNVFLVEPIINRGEELQTLGRVHRIGQTKQTCVHRFITKNTIEETIFKVMSTDAAGLMSSEQCTIKTLVDLFADTESQTDTMDA